jgi:hypothetical protein
MHDYEYAAQVAGDLQTRLRQVHFPLSEPVEQEIRQHVYTYADELRALGLPPERVIVAVKQLAEDAGLGEAPNPIAQSGAEVRTDSEQLVSDMVSWSIDSYYQFAPSAG